MLKELLDPNLSSSDLLLALKSIPLLKENYSKTVRHYVLETHTFFVINEFDKYFHSAKLPITRNLFRLLLALHDIGKPKASEDENISNQYIYTVEIINEIKWMLPFKAEEIELCISVVNGDPIGMYLRDKITLSDSKSQILKMASSSGITLPDFFRILIVYYQCDIASYTHDAGGLKFLEHLFLYEESNKMFDNDKGMLRFSSIFEKKYKLLKKEIL